jgi:hypothetical protein
MKHDRARSSRPPEPPGDKRVWLRKGDRISSTIEKLGELQLTLA